MHTTLGIDIGKCAVRLIICRTDNGLVNFEHVVSFPIDRHDEENGLDHALTQASEWIAQYAKKTPIDASGMTVDPTLGLATHRLMPFNDPRTLESIMPMQLAEIWTIDDTRMLAFEVGDYVKPASDKPSSDKKSEEDEENEDEGGYDIHVINYPIEDLSALLEKLNAHDIDPHVVLPANHAIPYAMKGILSQPNEGWAILDIGASKSLLVIGIGDKIHQTRAFKLGGASLDAVLAETFEISEHDACLLKEHTGFIAVPGMEWQVFQQGVRTHKLTKPEWSASIPEWQDGNGGTWPVDPMRLTQTCTQGLNVLATAVRQTLASFAAKNPALNQFQMYVTGGGAKLYGLPEWFAKYLDVPCQYGLPLSAFPRQDDDHFSLEAACAAVAAEINIEGSCSLNLRRGRLAHKGSLAYLKDNKWLLASLAIAVICAFILMAVTHAKAIDAEHAKLKATLESSTQNVFGKKLLKYNQIEAEIASSEGFSFIPNRTAFTHFAWISSQVNDNLSDIEMDLNSLDIDTQRKIVTIRGEVAGDDGLPRFMQLLEQYECFPNEIPEPKTTKVKERTAFTLRVDANNCKMGGDSE